MNMLQGLPAVPRQFQLDIFDVNVTHVVYRHTTPKAEPGPYQDLPNYVLHFRGRFELDSDVTVYLNFKTEQQGISKRHYDQAHQKMVEQLSAALSGDLVEHPQRQNLLTPVLLHGTHPLETVAFNPTDTVDKPVVVLTNDVAQISIFSSRSKDPHLPRGSMSQMIHGLVEWAGFEGFFVINGIHAGLGHITNREALVQYFAEELKKTWNFLPRLGFMMFELAGLKTLDNIEHIVSTFNDKRVNFDSCPVRVKAEERKVGITESWRNVNPGFVVSYLLYDLPAHEISRPLTKLYLHAKGDEPLVHADVTTEGDVIIRLADESRRDPDEPATVTIQRVCRR